MTIKVKIEWAKLHDKPHEYEVESVTIDKNGGLSTKTRAGSQHATPDVWKSITIENDQAR